MKFNPDLIQKARKGEIAILNDGTKEQLFEVLAVCCPQYQGNPSGTSYVYEVRNGKWFAIGVPNESALPAHSVKEFYMPDTTTDAKSYMTEITKPEQKPLVEFAVWGETTVQVAEDSWRRQKRHLKVTLDSTIKDIWDWANEQKLDLLNGLSINQIESKNPPK